jgi:uncharacterized membrane protein
MNNAAVIVGAMVISPLLFLVICGQQKKIERDFRFDQAV